MTHPSPFGAEAKNIHHRGHGEHRERRTREKAAEGSLDYAARRAKLRRTRKNRAAPLGMTVVGRNANWDDTDGAGRERQRLHHRGSREAAERTETAGQGRRIPTTEDTESTEKKKDEGASGRGIPRLRGPTRQTAAHKKKSGRSARDDGGRLNSMLWTRERGQSRKNWREQEKTFGDGSVCIRLTVQDLLVTFQQARYFLHEKFATEDGTSRYGVCR